MALTTIPVAPPRVRPRRGRPRGNTKAKAEIEASQLVGRRLAAAIAYRGVSLTSLAETTGINRQTLWRWLTGRTSQPFFQVAKIAKSLSVKLDFLAFGEGDMEEHANPNGA